MRKFLINKINREDGAAIVEFVIMTSIMIPLMLYVVFFSELIHFRLKTQEMKFFAGWEMTSYKLSNYARTPYSDANTRFTNASNSIRQATNDLYANWDSADSQRSAPFIMITPSNNKDITINRVAIDESAPEVSNNTSSGGLGQFDEVVSAIGGFLDSGIKIVLGNNLGFNTNNIGSRTTVTTGFSITSKMKWKDTNGFTNKDLLNSDFSSGSEVNIDTGSFTVLHDTWSLSEGQDVNNTRANYKCLSGLIVSKPTDDCGNRSGYQRQVQYMSFLGSSTPGGVLRALLNVVASAGLDAIAKVPLIGSLFKNYETPGEARMISLNYYYNSEGTYNMKDSKWNNPRIPRGQTLFQTTPLVQVFKSEDQGNSSASEGIREYRNTLRKRRNFYMGNSEPYCNFIGDSESCSSN